MKNKILFTIIMMTVVVLCSCTKKEAALTPSEENQGYVVPQGTNDYDATIVNFYNKFGTYLLYEFTDKDTYWTPTGWKNATPSTTTAGFWNTGYEMVKANPLYIKKQLALLDSTWFRYYTDKFLNEYLPTKIMLCTKIDSVYATLISFSPVTYVKSTKAVGAWYNYDNICVSNAGPAIDTMKAADKKAYTARINLIFAQSIVGRKLAKATTDFAAVANYSVTYTTYAAAYGQGILYPYSSSPTADLDWGYYIMAMVSMSETNLNASTANTDATFRGILNATKDVNGKIRTRYNKVRNYYITNYNVDLQAIGNAAN
ncbi:hypothetical protein FAM09_09745 [Niastella caeni]|uniref:Uncharacterized protein n=1 Tax=Niastella caeni TaxID=2569763 RepID=A0A4S8HWS8_9BACT|nr:hypothetical protein [Niastella caeni]THU40153.1 hypothetical protein FAM09_09745 [Niastella caeni]